MRAIVIGGGMVGAACTDVLARRGHQVTVVEAACVGSGATAAGMGHLVVMDDSPAQLALSSRSLELWEQLAPALPRQADYHTCGTLWIASDEEEFQGVLPKQAQYQAAGRIAEMIDARELAHKEPALRPGLAGALEVPGDSVVYAPVAAQFLIKRAGAQVTSGRVTGLEEGRVILADGRRLNADLIVLAAGIGASDLLPELPLRARKGQLLITERGTPLVQHQLVELGYLKNAHGNDADSVAFNVQPRPTGQLLIGSSRQFEQRGSEIDWTLLRRMLSRACQFIPALPQMSALRLWTGQRCATPDHLPIVGPHPERPGLFLAMGHEGLGITTSLGTAELLDQFLGASSTPLSQHDFGLSRFAGGLHA